MLRNNILVVLLFTFLFSTNSSAEKYDKKFEEKFQKVRLYLGKSQTGPAFLLLSDLYKIDPKNHYINYLIGVCYTEAKIITEKSIEHLKYASEDILDEYGFIPYTETRAPVFAWYYLTKAYSQNGMCAQARIAKNRFVEIYEKDKDAQDFFVHNINNFIIDCNKNNWNVRNKKRKESVITKNVNYTTETPLWGVQVGAFKELIPIQNQFSDLKNVEAFLDKSGTIRYIVGHLQFKDQALRLRDKIAEKGYADAFLVNVNEEKKFSDEIIIVDNVSFKARMRGRVTFKIQIGAFRDSIPERLAKVYLTVDDIEEHHDGDLTILTAGSFFSYEKADARKKNIKLWHGLNQAFITAYNNNRKVDLQAAIKHLRDEERKKALRKQKQEAKASTD